MSSEFYCRSCETHKPDDQRGRESGKNMFTGVSHHICKSCADTVTKQINKKKIGKKCSSKKTVLREYDPSVLYLSVKEFAKKANKHEATISHDICSGKLPAMSSKSKWFIHPEDAENYINN